MQSREEEEEDYHCFHGTWCKLCNASTIYLRTIDVDIHGRLDKIIIPGPATLLHKEQFYIAINSSDRWQFHKVSRRISPCGNSSNEKSNLREHTLGYRCNSINLSDISSNEDEDNHSIEVHDLIEYLSYEERHDRPHWPQSTALDEAFANDLQTNSMEYNCEPGEDCMCSRDSFLASPDGQDVSSSLKTSSNPFALEKQMESQLSKFNLIMRSNSDGDQLPYSIAEQLVKLLNYKENCSTLRMDVALYLMNHWRDLNTQYPNSKLVMFVDENLVKEWIYKTIYPREQERCDIEFAHVAACLFRFNLELYWVNKQGQLRVELFAPHGVELTSEPVRLAYIKKSHYVSVLQAENDQ